MKKLVALSLILVLLLGLFAGCKGKEAVTSETKDPASTSTDASVESKEEAKPAEDPVPAGEVSYPIETDETISYWVSLNGNVASNYASLAETPFGDAFTEQTGVKIDWQHAAAGDASKEQFNLMIASGDMPDIIEAQWSLDYPGGPVKAIGDGVIHNLTTLIDENAPDLKAYLEANPNIDKMIKTDDGDYFVFPFIRGDLALCTNNGPMFRADWLTDLGLEVPTTVDEWEVVLQAFKDEKGATAPYSYVNWNKGADAIIAANNTTQKYFVDGGKVVYGPVTEGYRGYLTTMADWYKKGLVDPDLPTISSDQLSARITSGATGAAIHYIGSGMGNWIPAGKEIDPAYDLVPAPWPTLVKGDTPNFGMLDNQFQNGGQAAITMSAKNPTLAAQLLNYGYSEAGHMLFNFGIEGVSYDLVGGEPTYTDLILKNPDGFPINEMMAGYFRAAYSGPMIQDIRYQNQYFQMDNQKLATKLWSETNMKDHLLPMITPTPAESDEAGPLEAEIITYMEEMTYKFILGSEPIENFDTYVETINSMGLETVLANQNAAYERFNAR